MSGDYLVYLAAALGLTVLVIVQQGGPGGWARERALLPAMTRLMGERLAGELLGCGVCFSAWSGLLVGLVVWAVTGAAMPLATLWLVAPFGFWMAARMGR